MFWRDKRCLVASALPVVARDGCGNRWRLRAREFLRAAESAARFQSGTTSETGVTVLKREENRVILRIATDVSQGHGTVVAKVFPLTRLRHRVKYHAMSYGRNRFAFGEACNLARAARAGLRVPAVFGYGSLHGSCGLVRSSVVLLEDYGDLATIDELLKRRRENQGECLALLCRMNESFAKLFRSGCRMVSFHSKDAVLAEDGPLLFDFEYAVFDGRPNLKVLMFEMASFAGYSGEAVEPATREGWVRCMLDQLGVAESEHAKLIAAFRYYSSTRLSRKDRLRIG